MGPWSTTVSACTLRFRAWPLPGGLSASTAACIASLFAAWNTRMQRLQLRARVPCSPCSSGEKRRSLRLAARVCASSLAGEDSASSDQGPIPRPGASRKLTGVNRTADSFDNPDTSLLPGDGASACSDASSTSFLDHTRNNATSATFGARELEEETYTVAALRAGHLFH